MINFIYYKCLTYIHIFVYKTLHSYLNELFVNKERIDIAFQEGLEVLYLLNIKLIFEIGQLKLSYINDNIYEIFKSR